MLSAGRATQIAMPLLSADEAEADETAGTLSERGSAAASDGLSWAVGLYRNSEMNSVSSWVTETVSRNVSNM